LREIHTKNASKLSFEKLYRTAYDLVLKRHGTQLYERVRELEKEWLHNDVRLRVTALITPILRFGGDVTDAMDQANERKLAGERFLLGLREVWEDHQLCVSMITDVLMYLVR
jgi:cullin 3